MAKTPAKTSKSVKGTTASPAAPPKRAAAKKAAPKAAKAGKVAKVTKVTKVAKGAKKLAKSPATAEIVAATLVAAAAALRNPKRAHALALEAADDIKKAAKSGIDGGEAMWKLAMDVARRSIDALGPDKNAKKPKKSAAKKKK